MKRSSVLKHPVLLMLAGLFVLGGCQKKEIVPEAGQDAAEVKRAAMMFGLGRQGVQ